MVNKSVDYGCKMGYASKKRKIDSADAETSNESQRNEVSKRVTFYAFPLYDEELTAQWVRAVHRDKFVPSKNSKLCSLHFHAKDSVEASHNTNLP